MKKELVNQLENGIIELIDKFHSAPYSSYSENDLQCALFFILSEKELNQPCFIKIGRQQKKSSILHTKYPTKGRYKQSDIGPSIKKPRGKKGFFDLCLWDPEIAQKRQFKSSRGKNEQRTFSVVEIRFIENHNTFQWNVLWDLLKLIDPSNEVENGYILLFVRDYPYESTQFSKDGFLEKLYEMFGREKKIKIIYIECNQGKNRSYMISNNKFLDIPLYNSMD